MDSRKVRWADEVEEDWGKFTLTEARLLYHDLCMQQHDDEERAANTIIAHWTQFKKTKNLWQQPKRVVRRTTSTLESDVLRMTNRFAQLTV